MNFRYFLVLILYVLTPLTDLFALELIVYPQKAPIGGINLSNGVVVIQETGEILSLSSRGYCLVDIPTEYKEVSVDIYVPGFQVAGGTFNSTRTIEIPITLQHFIADEVVIDLGESASMVLAARSIIEEVNNEVEENQKVDILNPPPDAQTSLNPFFIIELVVGKNMSEILGMDKK